MKHLLSIICSLVFCFSVLFSSCRTWKDEEDHCVERYSRWPRNSTTIKEIGWTKCYYEDGKLKERSFSFEENGCFHHTGYYSKTRAYYHNGKIESRHRSLGQKEIQKEYFITGGLRSKVKSYPVRRGIENVTEAPDDTSAAIGCGVARVKRIEIDSITGKRVVTISRDTLLKIRAKF